MKVFSTNSLVVSSFKRQLLENMVVKDQSEFFWMFWIGFKLCTWNFLKLELLLEISRAGLVVRVLNFEALWRGSIPWVPKNLAKITRNWALPGHHSPIPDPRYWGGGWKENSNSLIIVSFHHQKNQLNRSGRCWEKGGAKFSLHRKQTIYTENIYTSWCQRCNTSEKRNGHYYANAWL